MGLQQRKLLSAEIFVAFLKKGNMPVIIIISVSVCDLSFATHRHCRYSVILDVGGIRRICSILSD